jgi:hypothetical protein
VVQLKVGFRPSGPSRCPYCRDDIDDDTLTCQGCRAVLHTECAEELDQCPTLGCGTSFAAQRRGARRRRGPAPVRRRRFAERDAARDGGNDDEAAERQRAIRAAAGVIAALMIVGGMASLGSPNRGRSSRRSHKQRHVHTLRPLRQAVIAGEPHAFRIVGVQRTGHLKIEGLSAKLEVALEPGTIVESPTRRYVVFRSSTINAKKSTFEALGLELEDWWKRPEGAAFALRPPDPAAADEQQAHDFARRLASQRRRPGIRWLPAQVALLLQLHDPGQKQVLGHVAARMRRSTLHAASQTLARMGLPAQRFQALRGTGTLPALRPYMPPERHVNSLKRKGAFAGLAGSKSDPSVRALLLRYAGLTLWPTQQLELAELLHEGGGVVGSTRVLLTRFKQAKTSCEGWVVLETLAHHRVEGAVVAALRWQDPLSARFVGHYRRRFGLGPKASRDRVVARWRAQHRPRRETLNSNDVHTLRAARRAALMTRVNSSRPPARACESIGFHFGHDPRVVNRLLGISRNRSFRSGREEAVWGLVWGLSHGGQAPAAALRDEISESSALASTALKALVEIAPERVLEFADGLLGRSVRTNVARSLAAFLRERPALAASDRGSGVLMRMLGEWSSSRAAAQVVRALSPSQRRRVLRPGQAFATNVKILTTIARAAPDVVVDLAEREARPKALRAAFAAFDAVRITSPRARKCAATQGLSAEDPRVRAAAGGYLLSCLWHLRGSAERRSVETLVAKAMEDPEASVRLALVRATCSERTWEALAREYVAIARRDTHTETRTAAFERLCEKNHPLAKVVVREYLASKDVERRRAAVWQLTVHPKLGASTLLPPLAKDPDAKIRANVRLYLQGARR